MTRLHRRIAARSTHRSPEATYSHRMMRLINLIAKPFFARHAEQNDLSINEWRIVMLLAAHPESSASELAARSGMILMNVSRGVRRLVRMGRVARKGDPGDGRRVLLMLTARGRALYGRIAPNAWRSEQEVRALLSPREAAELSRLLDKLLAHYAPQRNDESA